MSSHQEFSPEPRSAAEARRYVSQHLSGLPSREEIILVVSELATNAIRHARTPFVVAIVPGEVVRLEVSDGSPEVPTIIESPDGHGHGLNIVDGLATRWGVEVTTTGKTVWVEIEQQEDAGGPQPPH
jgi:anti-sigma regulatory factor (Ser/Thr protein kinase)